MSTHYRKPDQIIQPYEYGHPESKRTCLWLEWLPLLEPTQLCEPTYLVSGKQRYSPSHYHPEKYAARWENQTPSGQNKLGPSPDRAKLRSLTYPGIAAAMAEQWGDL